MACRSRRRLGSCPHDDSSVTVDMQGRRLRLLKPGTGYQGAIAALDAKALEFAGPEPPVIVPLRSIARLDVRQRKSRKGRGVLIGALAGAAIGAIAGYGSGSGNGGGQGFDGASWAAGAGGVLGASVGALVGLLKRTRSPLAGGCRGSSAEDPAARSIRL